MLPYNNGGQIKREVRDSRSMGRHAQANMNIMEPFDMMG
jgi:hypothetical protein